MVQNKEIHNQNCFQHFYIIIIIIIIIICGEHKEIRMPLTKKLGAD